MKELLNVYNLLVELVPEQYRILVPLVVFSLGISLYGIIIWIFYRFLARRDIIKLNLAKYNVFEHAGLVKFFAVIFYIIEFLIVLPIVIFIWFAIFSVMMLILAKEHTIATVLLISAAVIAAIRITSYYKEDLSKDLAKMIPFTLLGVAILSPGFFNLEITLAKLTEVPSLFSIIIYYAVVIALVEIFLRLSYLVYSLLTGKENGKGKTE